MQTIIQPKQGNPWCRALISAGGVILEGDLVVPPEAGGVVVFAHGSGSSRHSPRNQYVADELNRAGLGTLLMDLLTTDEEELDLRTRHLRFDVRLLAVRLCGAVDWLRQQEQTRSLVVGLFGASTGAAAALIAAARRRQSVRAVVSRGGRPDLAGSYLDQVQSPTMLIVGSCDPVVLELNQGALAQLNCEKSLRIVQGATHLFEESGTLREAASLASDWFVEHLVPAGQFSTRAPQANTN